MKTRLLLLVTVASLTTPLQAQATTAVDFTGFTAADFAAGVSVDVFGDGSTFFNVTSPQLQLAAVNVNDIAIRYQHGTGSFSPINFNVSVTGRAVESILTSFQGMDSSETIQFSAFAGAIATNATHTATATSPVSWIGSGPGDGTSQGTAVFSATLTEDFNFQVNTTAAEHNDGSNLRFFVGSQVPEIPPTIDYPEIPPNIDYDPNATIDTNIGAFRASWDGRLVFIPRPTAPHWAGGYGYALTAQVFRPEAVTRDGNGVLNMASAFSPRHDIDQDAVTQGTTNPNTGLDHRLHLDVIPDPTYTQTDNPYTSDGSGNYSPTGAFMTYRCLFYQAATIVSTYSVHSEPTWPNTASFHARYSGYVVVSNPGKANAQIHASGTTSKAQELYASGQSLPLVGIEVSASMDGRLLVWNGAPFHSAEAFQKGYIDTIVYSFNQDPMAQTGWSKPRSISDLYYHLGAGSPNEPLVDGILFSERYPIAQQPFREANGRVLQEGEIFPGGYPWLSFDATELSCSTVPLFRGPRRAGLVFAGKLTNWVITHPDGPVNPCRGNVKDSTHYFTTPASEGLALEQAYNVKYGNRNWQRIMIAPLSLSDSMWTPTARVNTASDVFPQHDRPFTYTILHDSGIISEVPLGYSLDKGYLFRWSMNETIDYDQTALQKTVNRTVTGNQYWKEIWNSALFNSRVTGDLSGQLHNGHLVDGAGSAKMTYEQFDAENSWNTSQVLRDEKDGVFGDSVFCSAGARVETSNINLSAFQPVLDSDEFTLEFWFKVNSPLGASQPTTLSRMEGLYAIHLLGDSRIQAVFHGRDGNGNQVNTTLESVATVPINGWSHVALRLKDEKLLLNLNGDLHAEQSATLNGASLSNFASAANSNQLAVIQFGYLTGGASGGELQIDEASFSTFGRSDREIMDFAYRDTNPSVDTGFSSPPDLSTLTPIAPPENPFTQAKSDLGKKLFFDESLSSNHTISCASCHDPTFSYGNATAVSTGVNGQTVLNSPALINLAYADKFTWHGLFDNLESQSSDPITDPVEMDFSLPELVTRISGDSDYSGLLQAAYGVTTPTDDHIRQSLSAYIRSITSHDSSFDKRQLSPQQLRGEHLFFGAARCATCHTGANLTDNSLRNVGLDTSLQINRGRMSHTGHKRDEGLFKVPTLREISETAPYFHNGRFTTLHEVVDFYNDGGDPNQGENTDPLIRPLGLTPSEENDLVVFLRTLDGANFDRSKPQEYIGTPIVLHVVPGDNSLDIRGSNLHESTQFAMMRKSDNTILEVFTNNQILPKASQGGREHLEAVRVSLSNRYNFSALIASGEVEIHAFNQNEITNNNTTISSILISDSAAQTGGLSVDSDRDGVEDHHEIMMGTNPFSGGFYPSFIDVQLSGDESQASIHWYAPSGVDCQVEVSNDLQNWSQVVTLSGDGKSHATDLALSDFQSVPTAASPASRLFLRLRYGNVSATNPTFGRTWSINRVFIPAKSDRMVGTVGHRPALYLGEISNPTLDATGRYNAGLSGTALPADGLEDAYGPSLLKVLSGPQEGACYAITSSNSYNVWLDEASWNADGAPAMPAGTKVAIIPQWTVDTQFETVPDKTEVHLFDRNASGINNAPTESLTYYEFTDANGLNKGWWDAQTKVEQVLSAAEAYLIRNSSNTAMIHTQIGEVSSVGMVRLLPASGGERDHHLTLNSALPMNLADLSTLAENGDTMYLYNQTTAGYNNAPTTTVTYYFDSNPTIDPNTGEEINYTGWWQGGTKVDDSIQLIPGLGSILRVAPENAGSNRIWRN